MRIVLLGGVFLLIALSLLPMGWLGFCAPGLSLAFFLLAWLCFADRIRKRLRRAAGL